MHTAIIAQGIGKSFRAGFFCPRKPGGDQSGGVRRPFSLVSDGGGKLKVLWAPLRTGGPGSEGQGGGAFGVIWSSAPPAGGFRAVVHRSQAAPGPGQGPDQIG